MAKKEDGIFFMEYRDFSKYFSDVQFCYYYDDYKYCAMKIKCKNGLKYIKIEINKAGKYYFSLNQ